MPPFLPPPEPPVQIIAPVLESQIPYFQLKLQERGGKSREFNLAQNNTLSTSGVVEVTADTQEYDEKKRIITAKGNVVLLFKDALLTTDSLEVNLVNEVLVAEGNVVLERGEQVLRGDRFEYFFIENQGTIINAKGEIYQPTANRDFSPNSLSNTASIPTGSIFQNLMTNQPLSRITTTGGYRFVLSGGEKLGNLQAPEIGGQVNRLRFEAEQVNFDGVTWFATNVRLTNDPFSPPELEVRADTAQLQKVSRGDELRTTKSRIVFDDGISLPIFLNRLVFDSRPRRPDLLNFGVDNDERGGLFIERSFTIINNESVQWSITPQYFLHKALFPNFLRSSDEEGDGNLISPEVFGVKTQLNVGFGPRTNLNGSLALTSLNLNNIDQELRGTVRLQQYVGDLERPHTLNLEYSRRDRLFNGSLGFQTVDSSIGVVVTSPVIPLGKTGINLTYQGGIQNINSNSDRSDLVGTRSQEETNLTRYQGAAALGKNFPLFRGEPLAPTATAGLRYTPAPVVPYLQLVTGITGVGSFYSNGEVQSSLNATVGLQGQLGHFSRSYLDYTGFNLFYSQAIRGNESPFLFDRIADRRTLGAGLTQQLYGPVLVGFQTSWNLDSGETISTDYILEYSRRSYNITLRYNPVLQLGSISLRINDFNWVGNAEPFEGSGVRSVTQGVQ